MIDPLRINNAMQNTTITFGYNKHPQIQYYILHGIAYSWKMIMTICFWNFEIATFTIKKTLTSEV